MRLLTDAFEYNGWATHQLGQVCRGIPAEHVTGKEDWQYNSILGLWHHIDEVERAYLALMGAATLPDPADNLGAYLQSAEACREAFVTFAKGLDEAAMAREFSVPWFGREFTVADGMFQVLAHSIEHRADIAHFLSRLGHQTPPIDYVIWIYLRDGGEMPQ